MNITTQAHTFNVSLNWNSGTANGIAHAENREAIVYGAPPEFGGKDNVWSPEHLLAASIGSCYATTFFYFAKLFRVTISDFSVSCKAEFEKREKGFEATRYILYPVVTVVTSVDKAALDNVFQKAKKYCLISNSVKGEIVVEAEIKTL
jgi:organic hydroperoxide reductase OsmC/OhrA